MTETNHNYFTVVMNELPLAQRIIYDASCATRHTSIQATVKDHAISDVAMQDALEAVDRGMSIRDAARMYKVARSTLHDRVSGKTRGDLPGPKPYLTSLEEEELASFLVRCAEIGYGYTLQQVLALVQSIVDSKGMKKTVTRGWWQRYCQRHQNVALHTAVPLSVARAMASDPDVLDRYFRMLLDTFTANGLLHKPTQIYNCDETGMPLGATHRRVVTRVGSHPSCINSNSKQQITVLACVSAAGVALPPFVIFERKTINASLIIGEVPGTLYGLSAKGWITRELFAQWFRDHFLVYIPKHRPVVLLMDGHSSHYCPETIRMAAKEKVVLCTLPPHTTHLTQPLDRSCFGPLKASWRQVCQAFCFKNPGKVVSIYDFSYLFSQAWFQSMTITNIMSGFRVTGVFPVDRNAIALTTGINPSTKFQPEALAAETGLAYIPLYSPAPKSSKVTHRHKANYHYDQGPATPSSSCLTNNYSFLERSQSEDNITITNSSSSILPLQRSSSLGKFLSTPLAPSKLPTKRLKSCGQVLTSADFMKKMEDSQKDKSKKQKHTKAKKNDLPGMLKVTSISIFIRIIVNFARVGKNQTSRTVNTKEDMHFESKVYISYMHAYAYVVIVDESFSIAELQKFAKRYENGYDLTHDQRYNKWLEIHHPEEAPKLNEGKPMHK